jgi:cytochrome c553
MNTLAWIIALTIAISVFYGQLSRGANTSTTKDTASSSATKMPPMPQVVAQCASCHGKDGVSNTRYVPHLAGQRRGYLMNQLRAFHDNTRRNPGMHAVTMPLSETSIEDVAAYYWTQGQVKRADTDGGSSVNLDPKLAELVEKCDRCHEPNEYNQDAIQQYPILAGQRQEYLAHEMRDFQSKHMRDNAMMYAMTDLLIGEEVDTLAAYYENRRSANRVGRR